MRIDYAKRGCGGGERALSGTIPQLAGTSPLGIGSGSLPGCGCAQTPGPPERRRWAPARGRVCRIRRRQGPIRGRGAYGGRRGGVSYACRNKHASHQHSTGVTAMSRFASHAPSRPRTLAALALGAIGTAALLGSPALAAAAQPAAAAPQTTVHYSFRDLSTEQGTRALFERIVSAARTVCPEYDSRDLGAFAYSRECQRQAVARAVREIGNARLAAVYTHALARHG